jgi:hypothetical protein
MVFVIAADQMQERACSRSGRHIQHPYCQSGRHREQAHSYRFYGVLETVGTDDNRGGGQLYPARTLLAGEQGNGRLFRFFSAPKIVLSKPRNA